MIEKDQLYLLVMRNLNSLKETRLQISILIFLCFNFNFCFSILDTDGGMNGDYDRLNLDSIFVKKQQT